MSIGKNFNKSVFRVTRIGILAGLLVCSAGVYPAHASENVFSWRVRDAVEDDYNPMPHPGHDAPASSSTYINLIFQTAAQGRPVALMLQNDTGPYDGTKDPNALNTVMSYAPRLDFVFDDFESPTRDENTLEMVSQVRGHSNPNINNARVGSYAQFPGEVDVSVPFPAQMDRGSAGNGEHDFYLTSGLDVAMPNSYHYEYFETHANPLVWGSNISPNVRSALFWAPLERLSLAKRNLPAGHLLIPYIGGFEAWDGYDADPPEIEDLTAEIQHYRLRGADGFSAQGSFIDGYSHSQHRQDVLASWRELDWLFDLPGEATILNLDTSKLTGVEWSGVHKGNHVVIRISNLGNSTMSVDLPDIVGIPDWSPAISPGQHEIFVYNLGIDGDLNGDGFVGIDDLNIVLGAWNQSVPPGNALADPSGDGFVGIDDLNEVLGNWNAGSPPSGVENLIPEPSSIISCFIVGALLARRRSDLQDTVAYRSCQSPRSKFV